MYGRAMVLPPDLPEEEGVAVYTRYGSRLVHLGAGGAPGPIAVSDGAIYATIGIAGLEKWALPAAMNGAYAKSVRLPAFLMSR